MIRLLADHGAPARQAGSAVVIGAVPLRRRSGYLA